MGAGNDTESRVDNKKTIVFEKVSEDISHEEDFDDCPESGSSEERGEEEEVTEVPSEGEDDSEVPEQVDESDDDEFQGLCAYEKLRERNIRERKELLKDVLEG